MPKRSKPGIEEISRIRVDVGGTVFVTSRATLRRCDYFAGMCDLVEDAAEKVTTTYQTHSYE